MKILVVSPKNYTVLNFRGDLISELISLGHEVFVTGPNEDHLDQIKKMNVKFILIKNNKNGTSFLADYRYYKNLADAIDFFGINLVFCYTIKPVIYGCLAAKKCKVDQIFPLITGLGYVYTSRTIKARILRVITSFLYKIALKNVQSIIFQNNDDKEEFLRRKIIKLNQCNIVRGSGVNMNKFYFTQYPKEISFLMISRFLTNKGVLVYLKAAELIREKYPFVKCCLLGKIEDNPDSIDQTTLDYFIEKKCITILPETLSINAMINDCSVFVLPSYREGVPRAALEAMSAKRAIITTDAPGCKETVISGYNGFKIPVGSYYELVIAMEYFIKNPSEIEVMGNNSYILCKEHFEINIINSKILNIMKLK